jgi:hypothetical protein
MNDELKLEMLKKLKSSRERMQASKLPASSLLSFLRPLSNHLAKVGQEAIFVLFKFIQLLL